MEILTDIQKYLKDYGVKKNIDLNTEFKSLGIDSLDLVYLITELEKKYKVFLSNEELNKLKTINDLINLIKK